MSTEEIMIITDKNKDENHLNRVLKSWGYTTKYFSIKSPETSYMLNSGPDLILIDLNKGTCSENLDLLHDMLINYDAPVLYLVDDSNIGLSKPIESYLFYTSNKIDNDLKFAIEGIMSRHEIKKKLKEEEENLRVLCEVVPIPYQSLDPEGFIIKVNKAWLEKLGYKRDKVIGRWFGEFLSTDYVGKFKESFYEFKNSGTVKGAVLKMKRADGTMITVSFEGKVGYDKDNNMIQTHCIFQDITEQKIYEQAIKESEKYYKTIFENTGTATIIVEENSIVSLVNTEFEKLYGYKKELIEGKIEWQQFVADDSLNIMKDYHVKRRIDPQSVPRNYEFDFIDHHGNIKNIFATVALIPGTKKSLISLQDITDREKAENELKILVNEKDILLREIHHRVKNNLQIISSLLNLQSSYIKNDDAIDVFEESQNRIRSMAIIHEKLYQSTSMSKIDFEDYVTDLAGSLFYNYNIRDSIKFKKKFNHQIFLGVDTAIPCGLIINELITNSLKHAFSEDSNGEISIEFYGEDDNYIMIFEDDGIGFPEHIDFRNTESLGLQLIINLVDQLDGTITLDCTDGTKYTILFKELEYTNKR